MAKPHQLLLICGSLRSRSSNAAVLKTVRVLAPADTRAVVCEGLSCLPPFNPDDDEEGAALPAVVADLRGRIQAADALLLCTPEYAGGLPGSFKNLLDWTVGGGELYGKPVAWINASSTASPTGGADAHASLRKVLEYTGAQIVEAACVRVPVSRQAVGADGLIHEPALRRELGQVVATLRDYLRRQATPRSGRDNGP